MDSTTAGLDVLFILLGAVMVLAMHAGFAFLEVGTVRRKNQVNALVKILTDFAVSTIAYFFIGYGLAYGIDFLVSAKTLSGAGGGFAPKGYDLVKFFFLATFAAAIPAIVSGGIAERAKFWPQLAATGLITAFFYPGFEGLVWGSRLGFQDWMVATFGSEFSRFRRIGGRPCRSAVGWRLEPSSCWGPAADAIARAARWSAFRHRTFLFWRWAPGFSRLAGSASTS